MPDPKPQPQSALTVQLPPEVEVGVFADVALVWRTTSTFVLDFISFKQPAHPGQLPDGKTVDQVLDGKVAARVRIPPEQIFGLINALTTQSNQWLTDTGRSEPPESWLPQTTAPS